MSAPAPSAELRFESGHLRSLYVAVENLVSETQALFDGLRLDQASWRPQPKSWSILECFDHLISTNNQYFPRIQALIQNQQASQIRSDAPFKASRFSRVFIASLMPESPRRLRTFKIFFPASPDLDFSIKDRFLAQQSILAELMRSASGLDLNKPRLASPVTRLIRFSLGEALWLVTVHEQRHLAQAKRVLAADGFPT